jgi:uncharacterized membrane protein
MITCRREWDRLLTYVLFICYGVYSIFYPIISLGRSVENWIEVLLGLEFVFAGVSMVYGLLRQKWTYWTMGMSVASIGLFTISSVVAVVGGGRVLAYAFLFGAFAMQSLYSIRRQRTRRHEEEIRYQLEAIVASVRPERTDS